MISAMVVGIIKIDIGQIAEIGEYHLVVEYNIDRIIDRPRYNQNYRGDCRKGNFRENLQSNQNYRGGYTRNYRNDKY